MVYSDTSAKDGIIQMIEQTTNLGDASITGNTTRFAYFNNLVNNYYRLAAYLAWKADKNWAFDDTTNTTFSQPTTTLVNDQRDYTIPSTALRIHQVEVMNSSGNYYTLSYMPENDARLHSQKEQEASGIPTSYRLMGNSVKLYPAPDTSVLTATEGLRISLDREVTPFAVTDTTKTPGIALQFQPILYYGPSFEWASTHGLNDIVNMCQKMLGRIPGLLDTIGTFYAERNQDIRPSIKRKGVNYK